MQEANHGQTFSLQETGSIQLSSVLYSSGRQQVLHVQEAVRDRRRVLQRRQSEQSLRQVHQSLHSQSQDSASRGGGPEASRGRKEAAARDQAERDSLRRVHETHLHLHSSIRRLQLSRQMFLVLQMQGPTREQTLLQRARWFVLREVQAHAGLQFVQEDVQHGRVALRCNFCFPILSYHFSIFV